MLTTGSPNGFVRRVFESGADDILTLPEPPERVAFALEKAVARRRGAAIASGIALAPMICVLGPKGGTGKTLVSTNLAVTLALNGGRPVLIDLDLQFGDVGLALGLRPDKTIYDLARSGGSLDEDKLDAYLVRHSSGLRVNRQYEQNAQISDMQQQKDAQQQAAPQVYQQPAPPPPQAAAPSSGFSSDDMAQLKQLGQLHESGVLTDAEFEAAKQKILGT